MTRFVVTERAAAGTPAPSAGAAPIARSIAVAAGAVGAVFTVRRLLGGASTLALIAGSHANLMLDAESGVIGARAAIAAGATQRALVRESTGLIAIEYPVTIVAEAAVEQPDPDPEPDPEPEPEPQPSPAVTLSAAQVRDEGDSGTTAFTFTVDRSTAVGAVDVPWSFAPGGTSPADFAGGAYPAGGTVAMAPGIATGSFTILVAGDTAVEPDEAFTVSIAAPAGYVAGARMSATGTIRNDDTAPPAPPPTVTLSAAQSQSEGNSGTTLFTYVVTRSAAAGPVEVDWTFAAGSTSAADFVGGTLPAGGKVAMADGVATGSFDIRVAGDTAVEPDETFTVSITAPTGYAAGTRMSATGTIRNDDVAGPAPLYNPQVASAQAGQTRPLVGNDGWKRLPSGLAPNAEENLGVNEFGQVQQVAVNQDAEAAKVPIMHEFVPGDGYTIALNVKRPAAGQRVTCKFASSTNGFDYRGVEFRTKPDGGWQLVLPEEIGLQDTSAEGDLLPDGEDVHIYHDTVAKTLEVIISGGKSFGPYDASRLRLVNGAVAGNVGFAAAAIAGQSPAGSILGFPPKVWPGRYLGGSGRGNPSPAVFSTAPSIRRQGGGTSFAAGDIVLLDAGTIDPQTGAMATTELRRGASVILTAPLPPSYTLADADEGRALRIVSLGQNAVGRITQASSNTVLVQGTGVPQPQRILGMNIGGPEYFSSTRVYENLFLAGRWEGRLSTGGDPITLTDENFDFNGDGFPIAMKMRDGRALSEIIRRSQNVVRMGTPMRVAWTGDIDCSLFRGINQQRTGNRIDYDHQDAMGNDPYGAFIITAIRSPLTMLDCRERAKADNANTDVRNRVFNPAFIAEQSQFAILRAMDILNTNGNWREETWESRAKTRWRTTRAGAMPWEDVIAIANLTKCDLWINVPWRTYANGDAYARSLATLMRDTLQALLKLYIEIQNEVWNSQFFAQGAMARWLRYGDPDSVGFEDVGQPYAPDADGRSRANDLSKVSFDDVCKAYVRRMFEVFTVFGEVFAGAMSRIVRVAGSSPITVSTPIRAREFFNSWRAVNTHNLMPLVDAICVGVYFGYSVNPVPIADLIASRDGNGDLLPGQGADHPDWTGDLPTLFERTMTDINAVIDLSLQEQAWFAAQGKPMIVYEGYQSHADWIYHPSKFWNMPTQTDPKIPKGQGDRVQPVYFAYQRAPQMADAFELFGTRWVNEVQAPICGFVGKGMMVAGNAGPFGTGYNDFDNLTDPAHPDYAPKRAGMQRVLNLNPRQEVA